MSATRRRRRRRRRRMEDEDITQELFLDSSSEDKLMSHDSDQDESQDNTVDRKHIDLTWCTCNPQVYRGSQWDTSQCSSDYKQRFDPREHLHALFSGNYPAAGGTD
jgi:hypothetical protein